MGAVLNRSVAKDGVIAYQDSEDVRKFHYLPCRIDAVANETLKSFQVSYFGINAKPFYVDFGGKLFESCVGGVVSGQAIPDMTSDQRDAIVGEIESQYSIPNANLTPLEINEVKVQPIFAKTIADMGERSGSAFPATLKFGSSFNYQISSGNSLFAEMAGSYIEGAEARETPEIGVNISGLAEFYGDPWKAIISCDLSQVWEYTRTQVSAGIRLGWIDLGTEVDKIAQSLIRENIVKIEYIEGSGGDEFGRQLLETTKVLFEKINAQATSGEGFFKFEPNPNPQELPKKDDSWGSKLLPWTASVNVGYGENTFSQSISFKEEISFTGKLLIPINTSMNLALPCGAKTQQFFYDQQEKQVGCINKAKSDGLQKRLSEEANAKNSELLDLYAQVKAKQLTVAEYTSLKSLLNTITFTQDVKLSEADARKRFAAARDAIARPAVFAVGDSR